MSLNSEMCGPCSHVRSYSVVWSLFTREKPVSNLLQSTTMASKVSSFIILYKETALPQFYDKMVIKPFLSCEILTGWPIFAQVTLVLRRDIGRKSFILIIGSGYRTGIHSKATEHLCKTSVFVCYSTKHHRYFHHIAFRILLASIVYASD